MGISSTAAPLTMNKQAELMTQKLHNILNSACSAHGYAETSPIKMMRIERLLFNKDLELTIKDKISNREEREDALQSMLHSHTPVIVSKQKESPHHYSVATQLRIRRGPTFRTCRRMICSNWKTNSIKEIYVHDGRGGSAKWENGDIYFMAAIREA